MNNLNKTIGGNYERQDAINAELIDLMHNVGKILGLILLFVVVFGYSYWKSFQLSNGSILVPNIMLVFTVLLVIPFVVYFVSALRGEMIYKKMNTHRIDLTVGKDKIVKQELEINKTDISKVIYTKNYVVLRTNYKMKYQLIVIKSDWLSSTDNWSKFQDFIKDNWDPKN